MRAVWRLLKRVPPFVWRLLKKVPGYFKKIIKKVLGFLKKVPSYVWVIVLAVSLAHTFFWVGVLQVDPIFWACYWTSDHVGGMWIPELGLTFYQCFILFLNMAIWGFYILVAVILWLTAEHLKRGR